MGDFGQWLQWLFLLGCVLPLVILAVLAAVAYYFGRQWVANFVSPDVEDLSQRLETIRQKNPTWDNEKIIEKVVQEQALKCGLVGAVTGFGGFFTMIITLPLDLLVTSRYQASMVSFIAQVYGYQDSVENKAATFAVMTGTNQVSKMTTAVIEKYLPRVFGGIFSKLIPILGAGMSFAVNYFIARSTANLAKRWYSSKTRQELIGHFS
jgi:uncharacterized membrane protein required for colicin V production